jgi:AcrR family transcriptional regulator
LSKLSKKADSARKVNLSNSDFVDAAVSLAKEHGLSKLTMRSLADNLGVSPMALYYYIPNKEELFALTIDAIFARVKLPARRKNSSWKSQYLAVTKATKEVTDQFPDMNSMLLDIPVTPNGRKIITAFLEILIGAGFSAQEAMKAYSMIHTYQIGRMMVESTLKERVRKPDPSGIKLPKNNISDQIRPYLAQIKGYQYQDYAIDTILDAVDRQLKDKQQN